MTEGAVTLARTACRTTAMVFLAVAVRSAAAQAPAVLTTADGVLEFVANTTDGTVTVTDRLNRGTLGRSLVCPGPVLGALTPDEVSVLILCGGSNELAFLNTAAFDVTSRVALPARPATVAVLTDRRHAEVRGADGATLALVDLDRQRRVARIGDEAARGTGADHRNELVFLGMIHSEHRTSTRYGLDVLRRLVEVIAPDYWLTEIPPNRLARATEEFARAGAAARVPVSRIPRRAVPAVPTHVLHRLWHRRLEPPDGPLSPRAADRHRA